jgi:hypothetical protein
LSLLIECGAKTSEPGWMMIEDDQVFGTPLVLARRIQNGSSNSLPMLFEKIVNIISNENDRQCSSLHQDVILISMYFVVGKLLINLKFIQLAKREAVG